MSTEKTKAPKRAPKTTKSVQDLLNYIQQNLNAPKNLYNSFGKYSYRSAEGILEAVKPLLPEGATLILSDQVKEAGSFVFCEAQAQLTFKGETIKASAQAGIPPTKKGMDLSQIFGASSSYSRKYALNGLFLIDDTKDADTEESRIQADNSPSPTPLKDVKSSQNGKQWLNENDGNWSKVKAFIKKNRATSETLKSLETKYKISNANKKLLGFK